MDEIVLVQREGANVFSFSGVKGRRKMKLIYKGKYDNNPDSLPHKEHKPGAVKFKEFENSMQMGIFANVLAIVIMVVFGILMLARAGGFQNLLDGGKYIFKDHLLAADLGLLASMVTLFPHELLHAVCFKDEVHLYTNWSQGMLFVVGPEDMSKARFVFMSLLPNLVFGIIPFIFYLLFPNLVFCGTLGVLSIGMGAGDYYNVFNALTQMPKGARTYLHKFNSYWYIPERGEQ